ncbi:MAG: MFS transporter [Myxococcota bacterium]
MSSTAKASLGPVLLVNFIGTLGYTIAIPFLVFLVTRFGGDAVVYGIVASTYSFFQFLGAPILGRWSDRFGRRKILLLSQAGTCFSWILFGIALFLPENIKVEIGARALSLPLLIILIARAFDGLTGGNISVANAYVADISNDENRSKNFGRMGIASNLGMVLGPAIASILGATALGEVVPIAAAAGISFVGIVFIAFRLPESVRCPKGHHARHDAAQTAGQETRDCVRAHQQSKHPMGELLRTPEIGAVVALNFVIMASFSFFYTAFPINAATRLGWTVAELGAFFATLSLMLVIVQGPVLGWLSSRTNERQRIIAGLAILSGNFALMQLASPVALYIAAGLFALGNGVMWPSMVSTVSKAGGDELQGAVQGLAGSAGSLASVVGLALGGIAYEAIGPWTFLISAAFALLALGMAIGTLRRPAFA